MAEPLVLTQANVKALRYERDHGQPEITWDKTMVGLGVRVTANGAKSFVLRYRVLGRQRLATLGATHIHSVDKARRWARDGLAQADQGVDFRAAAEQQKALGTVAALWRRYIDEHVKVRGAERTAEDLVGSAHSLEFQPHPKKKNTCQRFIGISINPVPSLGSPSQECRSLG